MRFKLRLQVSAPVVKVGSGRRAVSSSTNYSAAIATEKASLLTATTKKVLVMSAMVMVYIKRPAINVKGKAFRQRPKSF